MSLSCPKIIADIKLIKQLQTELIEQGDDFRFAMLNEEVSRPARSEKLIKFFKVRGGLTSLIKEIEKELRYSFVVKDAINPYAETLKEGGVTEPSLVAEIKDVVINLQDILDQDRNAYEDAGCNIWAEALPEDVEDLNLTKEQVEIVKERIELGEIPIVMPGRLAQLNGLMQAIQKLKPKYIIAGEGQTVYDTYHWDYIDKLIEIMQQLAEGIANNELLSNEEIDRLQNKLAPLVNRNHIVSGFSLLYDTVLNTPERPYIFATSVKHEEITRNKTLVDQIEILKEIRTNKRKYNIAAQSIGENLALQNRFTERAEQQGGEQLNTLRSLDCLYISDDVTSRFIGLPVALDGRVPCGFSELNGDIWLEGSSVVKSSKSGFRYSVRV